MTFIEKFGPPLESGGGLAAIGLFWRLWKHWRHRRRFGRVEDEQLVGDLVQKAVETQADVLDDLRKERLDDRARILAQGEIIDAQRKRIDRLERRVTNLARVKGRLEGQVARLVRERDEPGP